MSHEGRQWLRGNEAIMNVSAHVEAAKDSHAASVPLLRACCVILC